MMPRMSAVMLAMAMLAPVLAGCFGGGADETDGEAPGGADGPVPRDIPAHALSRVEPVEITVQDEVTLRGHVYIPKGDGPFPVILNYSPYWNSIQGPSEGQASDDGGPVSMAGIFGPLMEAGFAVALINIRGTGLSDGCNSWLNPHVDGADAAHVIQELAHAPYSNGNIGMVGISWHGYTQYAALYEQPEALKAVAPASAVLDLWTLFTRRGPSINSQFGPMASTYAAFQVAIGVGIEGDIGDGRAACPEHAEQVAAFNQLTIDGDKTAFFTERHAYEILAANEIPLFVTNGLTTGGEGHILQVDGLWPLIAEEGRLMVGQWPHAYPDDELSDVYPQMLVQWFDHHLSGGPETVKTGVVDYQDDTGTWRTSPVWPPAHNTTRLFLSDGRLVADPNGVAASTAPFQSVYVDPRPDTCMGNKVLYVSPPLTEDVVLAGHFLSNVTVTSTRENGNFGLHLWHVTDLMPCQDMPAGVTDLDAQQEVSRALSDLRHRGHLEQGQAFPLATPDVLAMQSHPFASHVKAGERLVLGVAGGAVELAPRSEMPTIVVHTGPQVEAWVDLPVIEGRIVFEG